METFKINKTKVQQILLYSKSHDCLISRSQALKVYHIPHSAWPWLAIQTEKVSIVINYIIFYLSYMIIIYILYMKVS